MTNLHLPAYAKWDESANSLFIETPEMFSFEQNLAYLQRSSLECMYQVQGQEILKLIEVQGEQALISVSSAVQDNGPLRIRLIGVGAKPADAALAAAASYVWEWFDLGRDLAPFYALAERDPLLAGVTPRFHGLRIIGIADLFEALSWGILGQQINLTFAYTLKKRLVERYGTRFESDGLTHWLFPSPERIAELSVSELTGLQLTGKKAEYLVGVAGLMAGGALSKEGLLDLTDWNLMERELLQVRGIGPWTANYVLMRCLRNTSAFPIADVGLHNALKHLMEMKEKPSLAVIRQLAQGWTGWEAYATFYLWRLLY